ncbi:MAG: putative sugar O-methyltransferase [Solirubrobacteraceae bacterium]
MTTWDAITKRCLDEIDGADPLYRPTNFWQPGLRQLLNDMDEQGLERFKSWPTATYWFYPTYAANVRPETAAAALERALEVQQDASKSWLRDALSGAAEARRDLEIARIMWDQKRWPFKVMARGEARIGEPPQHFRLAGDRRGWTKPYLNYLLCLAALSRHVDRPPRSVLEIGGGFGVLGEILMRRSSDVRYVDLDIPPLLTVASYYLRELFGDRVDVYDDEWSGRVGPERSVVLPAWRIDSVDGPFDLFVNCFSFQEMEPHVVANYVAKVAEKDVSWVVSLNSRKGKPMARDGRIGVVEQVTSAGIIEMFDAHGYDLVRTYGEPFLRSAGELAVLRSRKLRSRQGPAGARRRLRSWRSVLRSVSGRLR